MALPLVRMPIVYLLSAVVAGLAFATFWFRGRPTTSPPTNIGKTRPTKAAKPADPLRKAGIDFLPPGSKDADGILLTREGLRRKVLVTTLGLVPLNAAEDGKPVGEPLDYASIAFVFGETNIADPPLLRIGPREGPPVGWVPADSVVEWETRLMARPVPRADRAPIVLYREENCLRAVLSDRPCPKHAPKPCPVEGEEPAGPIGFGDTVLGLPILRSKPFEAPGQLASNLLEVAALVADRSPIELPKVLPDRLKEAVRHVDVLFAIDSTASMRDSWNAALKFAMTLVESLKNQNDDKIFRFGLVEYRDRSNSFRFVSRLTAGLTDSSEFSVKLGGSTAAEVGDGSIDEAVFDGVETALSVWIGDRGDRQADESDELTTKLLVLIGDAPDHARDLKRAEALAARARTARIAVAAVAIERPDLLSKDEAKRLREQWQALARGSFRPIDRATNKRRPALIFGPNQAERLAESLKPLYADRFERAREVAARDEAAAESRLKEYLSARGVRLEREQPVMVDRRRQGDPRRRDPRHRGRRAPSMRQGWIAETLGGKPLVTIEVLMSRAELDALIAEFSRLQGAAQGSARAPRDLLLAGEAAAAGESAFLARDRGEQTFADFLRRREGLPPPRPDSLLSLTQTDLLQLDSPTRSALDARLRSAIAALVKLRSAWNDPNRTTPDGMAGVPYRWIDF